VDAGNREIRRLPAAGGVSPWRSRLSPDGRYAAVESRSPGTSDIWLHNIDNGAAERFTLDPGEDEFPVWAPDGRSVAYTSAWTGETRRIFVKSVEAGTEPRLVRTWPRHVHLTSWSPDGKWFAATEYHPTNGLDVWAIPAGGGDPVSVKVGAGDQSDAAFSPDSRWLAYQDGGSGKSEVYVTSFPGRQVTRQISTLGGRQPRWDSSGRTLYYMTGGQVMAVSISTKDALTWSAPRPLPFAAGILSFHVSGDGRRFILDRVNPDAPQSPIRIWTSWFAELKRVVAGTK
jgi:Tol biopolymer transport system component